MPVTGALLPAATCSDAGRAKVGSLTATPPSSIGPYPALARLEEEVRSIDRDSSSQVCHATSRFMSRSIRRVAAHRDPPHDPRLRWVVVDREVLGAAIVPEGQ